MEKIFKEMMGKLIALSFLAVWGDLTIPIRLIKEING